MHSSGSGFSPLPKQSRAPPTLSHPRHPQAPRLVSQIYFRRFFREPRWKHLPPAPWFEVQGVPCFKSNGRSSSADTEARRPVLLSRDDPQGREARFSHNGETRPKVLPVGELSWLPTEGGKRRLPESCKLFSLLKKLCEACLAGGKLCLPPERFTPRLLAPAVLTRMIYIMMQCLFVCNEKWSFF